MIENQSFSHSVESGLPVLQIPLDYGRRQQTFSYESTHITLKASLSRELNQKFGEQMVYPAFLSAYAALLFRLSAEEELAIGVLAPDQADFLSFIRASGQDNFQ